jgi:ATP-dependent exoDNAse (exonuclease V) alpha subunit
VDDRNFEKLKMLPGKQYVSDWEAKKLSKHSTEAHLSRSRLRPRLLLKVGALVMLRKNDIDGQFVNGSLGHVNGILKKYIRIELLDTGREIELETMSFELLDGDGNVTASAKNFPLTLAYGSTIHKAQGATIDRLIVDLGSLWESGQAYVALSRVKSPENLYLSTWSKRSIKADARVKAFHASLDQ